MKRFTITESQLKLALWAAEFGYDHLQQFLRHDEWDADIKTKRELHKALWSDRQFQKAIKVLSKLPKQKLCKKELTKRDLKLLLEALDILACEWDELNKAKKLIGKIRKVELKIFSMLEEDR